MSSCPGSTEHGCRCVEHHPGLGRYARDPVAFEQALAAIRGPLRLRVVTMGPAADPCTGQLTCSCRGCATARLESIERQRTPIRQPWEPRAA